MKNTTAALALILVAGIATAQERGTTGLNTTLRHVEIPGVQTFSGRMMVKPLAETTMQRLGYNQLTIEAKRREAELLVAPHTVQYQPVIDFYVVEIPAGYDENSYSEKLLKTGLYEIVEPDYEVYLQFTPNDPRLGQQWSHTNNQSANAWDIFRGNQAIVVAITDTGVHKNHEDFNFPASIFVPGYNSVSGVAEVNGGQVQDINGHGTHCAGIAVAIGDNARGVAGVTISGTRLMPVRVSNTSGGGSSISALTGGALWAAQNGARIVSTSYSGVTNSAIGSTGTTLRNTYNTLWFWASGNAGSTVNSGDWPNVTIVGSISSNGSTSGFSNTGLNIDVMAPGDNIMSTIWSSDANTTSYAFLTGTSMACPFAAGVGAAIMGMNPNLSADRVEDILERTSIQYGNPNVVGWGRVNLWNAMGRVANNATLFRGVNQGGNLQSLFRVEGDALRVGKGVTANAAEPPVQVVTEHNVSSYANYSEVNVMNTSRTNTTGSIRRRIQLWNFSTNQYDTIGETSIGTSYSVQEVSATNNPANYISGGIVRVRTQVFTAGPVSLNAWFAEFDQINVRTLRLTE